MLLELLYCNTKGGAINNIQQQLRLLVRLGNSFVEVLSLNLSDLEFESRGLT